MVDSGETWVMEILVLFLVVVLGGEQLRIKAALHVNTSTENHSKLLAFQASYIINFIRACDQKGKQELTEFFR